MQVSLKPTFEKKKNITPMCLKYSWRKKKHNSTTNDAGDFEDFLTLGKVTMEPNLVCKTICPFDKGSLTALLWVTKNLATSYMYDLLYENLELCRLSYSDSML